MFPGPGSVTLVAFTSVRAGPVGTDLRHSDPVRVYIGSDHAGFELKGHLLGELRAAGHEVVDVGPEVYDAEDDYPRTAPRPASGPSPTRAASAS